MSNMNFQKNIKHFSAGGEGTYDDPKVDWRLAFVDLSEFTPERQQGCEKLARAVTVALGLTNIELRAWNHETQYVYDERGQRVYYIDENGRRRPKLEKADSHMTARMWDAADPERDYNAHIYSVDDDKHVPQRLMLISERLHTRDHDRQSPQLWPYISKKWKNENPPRDALEEFIRSQWIDELILFDVGHKLNLQEWDKACRLKQAEKEALLDEDVLTPDHLQQVLENCGFYG
ncbi:hypothetical protein DL767_002881 [Monosporascus sp. MG133]|nr:hypothetical protein DL767_002881 [Monosporascus sp. MG133]